MSFTFWILPYFILLVCGVIIPSDGSHGILNIKSLAYVATLGTWLGYIWKKHSLSLYQLKLLCFFLGSIVFLLAWLLLGLLYDHTLWESQIDQFKVFIITLTFAIVTLYWFSEEKISFQQFFKILVYANFTYSLSKVLLVALHFAGIINMFDLLQNLGLRFMSMTILGNLSRMQTSVDIIAPFLLFFVLMSNRLGITFPRYFTGMFMVISWLAIFLSFSRFMLAVAMVSTVLYIVTLNVTKITTALFTIICGTLLTVGIIGPQSTADIIEKRFFSKETVLSDKVRYTQIDALKREQELYPLFGKGLGSYTKQSIRDTKLLHSYEVQWMAFLMQFGLVGIVFLLIPAGMISFYFLSRPNSRLNWAFFCMFVMWLLAGFTNPFLISLTSGIIYSLFLLVGKITYEQAEAQRNF